MLGKYFTRKSKEEAITKDWEVLKDVPSTSGTKTTSTQTPKQKVISTTKVTSQTNDTYCVCNTGDDGSPMLACENSNCPVEWYHLKCIQLDEVPAEEWYCHLCRKH